MARGLTERGEWQHLPNRKRDRCGITINGGQRATRLLGARRGNAAHRINHRAKLPDAVDPGGNIGQAIGHGGAAGGPALGPGGGGVIL